MNKINDIIRTETYVELDTDNGGKILMPASQTIFVDDNSGAISVKTTGSRKTLGYMVSGGTPPVPPTPPTFEGKWKATYLDGHVESAECDASSAMISREINNTNAVSCEIGDCVTEIGKLVFDRCSTLTSITIPNSVTTIGQSALSQTGLITLTIPDSVTNIGIYAVAFCSNITSITCLATTPPFLGGNVFYNTNNCPIYVPAESVEAYKAASIWSTYASRIQAIQ